MVRILVDFNTTMQDVKQGGKRMTLGLDEVVADGDLPALRPAERTLAHDDDMEVEGVVEHQPPFWVAALDCETLKCLAPAR
jgi:hypothetical protein